MATVVALVTVDGNPLSETLIGSSSIAVLHHKIDQGLAHARLFATR